MTDDRIRQFRLTHQSIVDTIDRLQATLRNYNQAKPILRELFYKLSAYLGSQDSAFFTSLKECSSDDRETVKMIDFLQFDLKEMKIRLLQFHDSHSGDLEDSHARNFPGDFAEFAGHVVHRIKTEEEFLFPLLEKSHYSRS